MTAVQPPMAWLPHSIAEASTEAPAGGDVGLPAAWSHLMDQLNAAAQIVESDAASRNRVDSPRECGICWCCWPRDRRGLAVRSRPILRVQPASTDDILTWGMECPDCLYTRATLRGGESYRLFGNRGTARYVGLQTMKGIVATANVLVDELDSDGDGNFEVMLSADEHDGNWMRIDGDHPTLTVRHFFYDWDTEMTSSLAIERIGDAVRPRRRRRARRAGVAAAGRTRRFRPDNLTSSCSSGRRRRRTAFCRRSTAPR